MKTINKIKHSILLVILISMFGVLAFSLEGSKLNSINNLEIEGAKYLTANQYLEIANLTNFKKDPSINISVIQDRLEKHPYIKNADVWQAERGTIKIKIFEKKLEALLLTNTKQFLLTDQAEIIPYYTATKHIDLPVIVNLRNSDRISAFKNAGKFHNLVKSLNIISASEIYDEDLYKRISEINFNNSEEITLTISDLKFPIYLGKDSEIEKTIYLSKIIKHIRKNNLADYMDYLDLRFTDLVYLGFDKNLVATKETI
ncbi:MAG: cell division protein FtsQ/DivIB [Ignavibacteriae bacterium]|nr:cell division protein FtsQ/DivIB [Ignavibacteriota bacterium]